MLERAVQIYSLDNIISLLETYTFWLARLDLMNLIVMFIDISML